MKRFIGSIICILTVFLMFSTAYAGFKISYDGKTYNYNAEPVYLFVNNEKLTPPMPPIILNNKALVPARAVFEKMGAKVGWDSKTQQVSVKSSTNNIILKINSGIVNVNGRNEETDVPPKIINGSTMIPLRFVSEKLGLKVGWDDKTRTITINSISNSEADINKISTVLENGKRLVKIEAAGDISNYSKTEWAEQKKLIIDIPDSIMKVTPWEIPVNGQKLQKIRVSQYEVSPPKSRVVLDLNERIDYSINLSQDKRVITIDFEEKGNSNFATIGKENDFSSFNSKIGDINNVSLIEEDDKIGVCIQMNSSQDYEVSRITEEDGIAVDITNADFTEGDFQIPVKNIIVKYLKSHKPEDNAGRIIIGVYGQPSYQVFKEPGKLSVYIFKPTYKNILYTRSNNISSIIIDSPDAQSKISIIDDSENHKVIFSIPEGVVDLGTGNIPINDELIKSVQIAEKASGGSDIIVHYNYEGKLFYEIKKSTDNKTIIDIAAEEEQPNVPNGKFLVVIDPGHGGYQPGAKYKNEMLEKDLNLDISIRLNKLLKEAGINTVMTRETDVAVGLHERADIANNLNADLFVSIHNNWIDPPKGQTSSIGGTETLYYPSDKSINGLTRKRFAQIVQEELLKELGTADRRIVERPGLVVLNSTKMPAVLAEIAFMSNENDRKRLSTAEFRQDAAKALFNGIIRALGEIKK